MHDVKKLLLKIEERNEKLFYNYDMLIPSIEDLENFLCDIKYMKNINFTKKVLFPYEVKMNNEIEGYHQDIEKIVQIINNPRLRKNRLEEEYQRVINLCRGYNFVLEKNLINKKNLKLLYSKLSKNLLDENHSLRKKQYYRDSDVYIHFSCNVEAQPKVAVKPENINDFMDDLFEYINTSNINGSITDTFIKSQIIHFYFVYIHPYYDVNGRSARTVSLWYLINNEAYPLTLFNRGIPYDKSNYYKTIREAEKYKNLTYFLHYMLRRTNLELEKEYVVDNIESSITNKLSYLERQTLFYILSNPSNNTLLDFTTLYNRYNKQKKAKDINVELLQPLIDKDVIIRGDNTNKKNNYTHNYFYILNSNFVDDDPTKIKKLNINKYKQNN